MVLAILMLSTILLQLNFTTVNAQAGTGQKAGYTWAPNTDYGNLLQYEWPQQHGQQYPGGDGGTYYSAGPAPDAANVKWQVRVQDITKTAAVPNGLTPVSYLTAFNGMVFRTTSSGGGGVIAINALTGALQWTSLGLSGGTWSTGPGGSTVYKISDSVMTAGPYGLEISTGRVLWNASSVTDNTPMGPVTARYNPTCSWPQGSHYDSVLKMMFTGGRGWNLSDPYHEPKMQWSTVNRYEFGTGDGLVGNGVVAVASNTVYRGFNATTGKLMWETNIEGIFGYSGVYYDGKVIHGSESGGVVECFNITDGKLLWTYNSGKWMAFWACAPAAAYGRIYYINDDQYMYCLDANTGKELWEYPMVLGYQSWPIVADGKVYTTTKISGSIERENGYVWPDNRYDCIDAFTGQLIWSLPYGMGTQAGQCIAFGNLYLAPSGADTNLWCISSTPIDWSNFRGDPEQSGKGSGAGPMSLAVGWDYQTKSMPLSEAWEYKTGGSVISSPVASNGKVYVGSTDKYLYCLDQWTGNLIWKALTGTRLCSAPAVVGGKVYTGPDDGYVHCYNADTGQELWKADAGASSITFDSTGAPIQSWSMPPIQSSPVVVGGRVYVGSISNKTYCFDATTGTPIWSYPMPNRVISSPVVIGNDVYVYPASNGSIYKLRADTGALQKIIWVPGTGGTNSTAAQTGTPSPTIVGDGTDRVIYIPADSSFWYAINETTGGLIWRWRYTESFNTRNTYSMLYIDWLKAVIIVDRFNVKALDTTNITMFDPNLNTTAFNSTVQYKAVEPNVLWSTYTAREVAASPVYASVGSNDGVIYVSTDSRIILAYDAKTGAQVGVFDPADLDAGWSSPAIYNGMMIVGNNNWKIYAFAQVPKQILPITVMSSGVYVKTGVPLTISGKVAVPNFNVTVTISLGTTVQNFPVKADASGAYSITYTPTTVGTYSFMAWTSGYKYYGQSYSDTHYFAASAPSASLAASTPASSSISLNADQGSSAAQPVSAGTANNVFSMEYVCALIAVAVIAITAAALVMKKKAKK
jgi:outer membrane protein assembly factor BamB